MTQEHHIGGLAQIPRGEGRNFRVADRTVAVFHTQGGEVYATQAACPHRNGPLADGLLGGTTLVCPLHERTFDLRTGAEAGSDCRLTVYPARVTTDQAIIVTLVAGAPG